MSLSSRISKIKRVINTRKLLNEVQDEDIIKQYYKTNKVAYRIFHNWGGFLHMSISKDNVYRKADLLAQAIEVNDYITKNKVKSVLELASGRGSNSYFLAKNHPGLIFNLMDLSTEPLKKYSDLKNFKFNFGDYHELSNIETETIDVVFIIEALCHSDNKPKVIKEVKRVLRKGGVFFVWDGYLGKPQESLSVEESIACSLTEKGMAVDKFEFVDKVESYFISEGFDLLEKVNLSSNVLPNMKRFERLSRIFFKLPFLARALVKILPEKFVRNSISGYLMPLLIKEKIAVYYKHLWVKS